jgi:hypothetical protein
MSEPRTILVEALREFAPKLSHNKAGELADHLILRLRECGFEICPEDEQDSWQRAKVFEPDEE